MPSVCQLHFLRLLSEHFGNVRVSSGWKVEDTFAKTIPFYFCFMAIFMLSSPFSSDFILTELYFNAILPVKVDRIYNNLFLFYVYNCEPIFKQVRTAWCILSLFLHLIVQYWKYNNYTNLHWGVTLLFEDLILILYSGSSFSRPPPYYAHWGICGVIVNYLKYLKSPLYFTKIYSV